jgi:Uma2 family endonuclease
MTTMTWQDVLADPSLQNLPYKIELNKAGRIEMSPASNQHGKAQVAVAFELGKRPGGKVLVECSIQTTDGVRVADVAWISDERDAAMGEVTPYPQAPELCVEIMSPSNTWPEMFAKASLYLAAGASEVWIQPLSGERRVIRA